MHVQYIAVMEEIKNKAFSTITNQNKITMLEAKMSQMMNAKLMQLGCENEIFFVNSSSMKPKKLSGTYKDEDNLCLASTGPDEPPIALN